MSRETRIAGVIFDWAGTTIDYGCFAPLDAFITAFRERGVDITISEVREPMGLPKKEHIRSILHMKGPRDRWKAVNGKNPDDGDVSELYARFEPVLMESIVRHAELLPGVKDTVHSLRASGIKIGSTTGYTADMMRPIIHETAKQGYLPDLIVTPDDVPGGRPYPWMIMKNMIELGMPSSRAVLKVGDTLSDIAEGLAAGVWSAGVIEGSSELGLSRAEYAALGPDEKKQWYANVRERYFNAGAHIVMDSIDDTLHVVRAINSALADGAYPHRLPDLN